MSCPRQWSRVTINRVKGKRFFRFLQHFVGIYLQIWAIFVFFLTFCPTISDNLLSLHNLRYYGKTYRRIVGTTPFHHTG